jgi:ATP-dependent DNA helicase DinG
VPGIASEHFGLRLSSYAIDFGLKRLFNPRKRSGLLKRQGRTADLKAVESALAANADFFQFIAGQFLRQRDVVRITEPGFVEDVLSARLRAVVETLGAVESRTEKEEQVEEIRDHKRRIQGFHSGLGDFLKLARDDHVHWLEKSGRRGSIVALRTAPINVAPYLKEALFARESAAVLTSATLSIGDEMANFQKSIGGEGLDTGIEASPFDFKRNLRVFIATDAPAPQPQNQARLDRDYLLDMLTWCTTRIAGGSLILFTSYADLNGIATDLQANLQEWGRPVFIQGRDESRQEITRAFAAAGNGILLGTESFWTGVDVPGPALSQVVITRLPFDNPTHPIPQARSEAIEARGGNPFAEMALPEAMLKFRQGVGRLIRKADDRGCVTILDSRILNKSYGQRFIEQLPVKQYRRLNKSNRSTVFPNHEEF